MKKVIVGMSTCGLSAGSQKTYDRLGELLAANPGAFELKSAGCIGMCYREPLVEIRDDASRIVYGAVTPELAEEIFSEHIKGGRVLEEHVALRIEPGRELGGSEAPHQKNQVRIVLRNCGLIDPESIAEYEAAGGYRALRMALLEMKPDEIIKIVKDSGLRGRGGAGFPTGLKWSFAAVQKSDVKYVVCNADEGDPGAFMDRSVLEGDPHSVIEGMIICGKAIGAHTGYVYCRAEYPMAIRRLTIALEAAREKGHLGTNILGSGFDFDIKIKQGAGAFVCGEETALFQSIEGKRGMPRIRPPFPAEKGLWQKPTNNNNVETYANVPWILRHREEPRHEGLRARRQGRKRRPRRGSDGYPHQRPRLQDRRGDQGRPGVQGGADGRAVGRMHTGLPRTHAGRFRIDPGDRRHHGLGRHGRHGRSDLHGRDGAILPRLHAERVVRKMHILPRRHAPDARDPHPDHEGGGSER
jgi:NADH-quinone oxidoreductase subunit F